MMMLPPRAPRLRDLAMTIAIPRASAASRTTAPAATAATAAMRGIPPSELATATGMIAFGLAAGAGVDTVALTLFLACRCLWWCRWWCCTEVPAGGVVVVDVVGVDVTEGVVVVVGVVVLVGGGDDALPGGGGGGGGGGGVPLSANAVVASTAPIASGSTTT